MDSFGIGDGRLDGWMTDRRQRAEGGIRNEELGIKTNSGIKGLRDLGIEAPMKYASLLFP